MAENNKNKQTPQTLFGRIANSRIVQASMFALGLAAAGAPKARAQTDAPTPTPVTATQHSGPLATIGHVALDVVRVPLSVPVAVIGGASGLVNGTPGEGVVKSEKYLWGVKDQSPAQPTAFTSAESAPIIAVPLPPTQTQLDTANAIARNDKSVIAQQGQQLSAAQQQEQGLDNEVSDLQSQNGSLQTQNSDLQTQNGNLKQQNAGLLKQNDAQAKTIVAQDKTIQQDGGLQTDLQHKKSWIVELRDIAYGLGGALLAALAVAGFYTRKLKRQNAEDKKTAVKMLAAKDREIAGLEEKLKAQTEKAATSENGLELTGEPPAAPTNDIQASAVPTGIAADLSKMDARKQDYQISFGPMPDREKPAPKASAEEIAAAYQNKIAQVTMPEGEKTPEAAAPQQPAAAAKPAVAPAAAASVLTDEERHKLALGWLANLDKSPSHKAYQISENDKGEHIVKDIAGREIAIVTPDRIAVHANVATSTAIKDREAMEHLIQAAILKHNGAFYANNASPEVAEGIARITQQMLAEGKLLDHAGNKLSEVKFNGVDLKDKQVEPEPIAAAPVVSLDNVPTVTPPSPPVPLEPAKPNYRATLDEAAAKARVTNQTNSTPVVPPAAPAKSDDYLWTVKPGNGATYKVKKPSGPAAGM